MRWFSFLVKVAAVCNIMFIVATLFFFFISYQPPMWLTGTILVLGWFPVSPVVNILFATSLLFILFSNSRKHIPKALTIFNIVIAVLQFIFYLTNVIGV